MIKQTDTSKTVVLFIK